MLRKTLILIISVSLCLILQAILLGGIQVKGGKPNLLLILLILWAWKVGWKEGLIVGFIVGILEDILFSSLLGLNAFSLSVVGFLVGEIKERVYEENVIVILIVTAAASILNGIIFTFWVSVFSLSSSFLEKISSLALLSSLYNCLLVFVIFLIRERLWRGKIR